MGDSEKLKEAIERLSNQLNSFKTGHETVAVDMSVLIRVIVYNNKNQKSLLNQIGQENIPFLSTLNTDWEKGISFRKFEDGCRNMTYSQITSFPSGLVGAITKNDHSTKYVPLINLGVDLTSLRKNIDFDEWWEKENIGKLNGNYYKRKTLVLSLAHKGGGAHFDSKGSQDYVDFKKRSVSGIEINGDVVDTANYPLFSIICEIAFELLESIKDIII